MPESQPDRPALRFDTIAASALFLAAVAAIALATHPPLTGLLPAFGPMIDSGVAPVALALGFAVVPVLAAWVVLSVLYIRNSSAAQLAIKSFGWLVLVATSAIVLDFTSANTRIGYGAGGSVGASLRYLLEDRFSPFGLGILLGGVTLFSLALIAPKMLRSIGLGVAFMLKFLWHHALSFKARLSAKRVRTEEDVPILLKLHQPRVEKLVPIHNTPPVAMPGFKIVNLSDQATTDTLPEINYELPPLTLLNDPEPQPASDKEVLLRERATLLEKTFSDFGISVKVVGIHTGPVITQYEIALETGLRLNKVTTLADDVALNLKVQSVRIVAPLPGRNTVGIELPNEHRQTVRLKELITTTQAKAAKFKLPVFIGKDVEGRPLVYDLASMPHLLIAGRTGTGKSVCLNSIILSLLYSRTPEECRLIMIDPKMVELSEYGKVPHLMHPVVTKPEKAEAILAWAVDKMEERYSFLSKARVRNVASWNELEHDEVIRRIDPQSEDERQQIPRKFPYIVIIIDEVGDLLMSMKKEVETHIIRLAQKSRAAGIHVILATQKPTVDVITGLIKSNMPARICFQVASRADSMVVLDEKGADKLLGMGDMLFLQPASSTILRAQGAFVDDKEIERTVNHLETDEPNFESELLNLKAKAAGEGGSSSPGGDFSESLRARDEVYEQAIEVVIREQRGSTSLLQRALGIGYGRASRLIDFMAEDGIVGSYNGSNARDVLLSSEEWQMRKNGAAH